MNKTTAMQITLNINHIVRVRLTNHGRAFHAMKHAMFNMKSGQDLPYIAPKEDSDGWSDWQMHDLMHTFGELLYVENAELPFDMTIVATGDPV